MGWPLFHFTLKMGNSNSLLSKLVWLYYFNVFINIILLYLPQENKNCNNLIAHLKNFMKDLLTLLRKYKAIVYTPRLFKLPVWKPLHCCNHHSWSIISLSLSIPNQVPHQKTYLKSDFKISEISWIPLWMLLKLQ